MSAASTYTFPADPFAVRDRVRARQLIGAEVDRLIAYLDALDGDPDLEETGDLEPSLGYYSGHSPDLELDTSDDEPSLGSFDRMVNQEKSYRQCAYDSGTDRELDRSDFEDGGDTEPNGDEADMDADREPSLGSLATGADSSQEAWSRGSSDDQEQAVPVDPVFRRPERINALPCFPAQWPNLREVR